MPPYKALIWLGVVDRASNLSTQKAEAGGSPWLQGQSDLYSELPDCQTYLKRDPVPKNESKGKEKRKYWAEFVRKTPLMEEENSAICCWVTLPVAQWHVGLGQWADKSCDRGTEALD